MAKEDKYVHEMDWGPVSFVDFKNYRNYQYALISDYVGKNIIEVGSGDRSFTKQIYDNAKDLEKIYSIEPSETLFKKHANNYSFSERVEFECIDLFDLDLKKGMFDTAIFIHVLEHIKDDKKALDKIAESVVSGGYVLIEVPALPFLFSVHDQTQGHYRRYNKTLLRSAIDTNQYDIVRMWYQDPIGILGSLFFFKLLKIKMKSDNGVKLAKKQGGIYDKFIIPIERGIERVITFPFGLSLTVILRKK